jgi:hypothetical protein
MQPIEARDILGSKESIVLDSGMAPMGTEDTDVSALVKSIKDTSGVLVRAYFANFRREPDNRKFPQMTYGTTPFSRTPIPRLNKSFKAEHANTKIYSPFIDSLLDDEARRINKIQ